MEIIADEKRRPFNIDSSVNGKVSNLAGINFWCT